MHLPLNALRDTTAMAPDPVVLVSNELGLGVPSLQAAARARALTRDRLRPQVFASTEILALVVGGQPLTMKGRLP